MFVLFICMCRFQIHTTQTLPNYDIRDCKTFLFKTEILDGGIKAQSLYFYKGLLFHAFP